MLSSCFNNPNLHNFRYFKKSGVDIILHKTFISDGKSTNVSGDFYNILFCPTNLKYGIQFHYNRLCWLWVWNTVILVFECEPYLYFIVLSTCIFNGRAKIFILIVSPLCVRTILVIVTLHEWPGFDPHFSPPLQVTKARHMCGGLGTRACKMQCIVSKLHGGTHWVITASIFYLSYIDLAVYSCTQSYDDEQYFLPLSDVEKGFHEWIKDK